MKTLPIALAVTMLAAPAFAAGDAPAKPVKFAPGARTTVLKGVVKGYATARYSLAVDAGQTFQMLFKPSNGACYFNATANGASEAEHIGSSAGNEFSKNVAAKGNYQLDVYLMRSAARRKESCRYALSIEFDKPPAGAGASAGGSNEALRDVCKAETAKVYQVEVAKVTVSATVAKAKRGGFTIDGTIDKGAEGIKKMRCIFRANRTLDNVMAMTPDGE